MKDINYCLVPDCDEQPEVDGELCRTHEQEAAAIERNARRQAIRQVMREETRKSLDYRLANDDLDGYDYTGGGR